ncbi:MAG: capsular biosynthesis protein [Deltaproteobacteria bacterium]|nr:capsular biosynthesis protein [Deltaproteobacteria bacterium]
MKRSFLFLQGPHGPFFRQLGSFLAGQGHRVRRVNFHGGDVSDWSDQNSVDFLEPISAWPGFCRKLLAEQEISDLVVYGDCRCQHTKAMVEARLAGVRIHVFEEGYLRPHWITLQANGVNGHSELPKTAAFYLDVAKNLSEPAFSPVGPAMRWQVGYCLRYYAGKIRHHERFHHYLRHRPLHPVHESRLWLKRFLCHPVRKHQALKNCRDLQQGNPPYYLVCLQLDSDAQIQCHSPFTSVAEFISQVLRSFANFAPENTRLVIKNHPLDNGAVNYQNLITIQAHALGIEHRVIFLHYGPLATLIRGSQGVVLVNSTVGTQALFHAKPTVVLGRAVYDFASLTFQGGLDDFWYHGEPPDRKVFQAFRLYLFNHVLLNGSFYAPKLRKTAIVSATKRLSEIPHRPAVMSSRVMIEKMSEPAFP